MCLLWGAGNGEERETHTHTPLYVAPEAGTTSRDSGGPHTGVQGEKPFPRTGCVVQRLHQRGHFHWKSYQEIFLQSLAVPADENKMFALAICLVLKTSLDNAKALVENSRLCLLGWSQEGCFE